MNSNKEDKFFNFKHVAVMLWASVGCILMLLIFVADGLGWWNILYFVCVVLYMASCESVMKFLLDKD